MLPSDRLPRRETSRATKWIAALRRAFERVVSAEGHSNAYLAVGDLTQALRDVLIVLNDIAERERILEQAEAAANGDNA